MKNNTFKQGRLKSLISMAIFTTVILLGGTIFTLASPSSLDDVISTNANNKLSAENRDYVVRQVKSIGNDVDFNINAINVLSGRMNTLSGKVTILSGMMSNSSSLRQKSGNNIYYNSGNVGIGTLPSSKYGLAVNGIGRFNEKVVIGPTLKDGSFETAQYKLVMNGPYYLDGIAALGTEPVFDSTASVSINNKSTKYGLMLRSNNPNQEYSLYTQGNIFAGSVDLNNLPSTTLADKAPCTVYEEGTIIFRKVNNNESRLFVCEKLNGGLKWVAL